MRGPVELLTESWNIFQGHWKLFLGIFLVPGLISAVFDYISYEETVLVDNTGTVTSLPTFMVENPAGFWVFFLFLMLALVVATLATIKAVVSSGNITVKEAYEFAKQQFVPFLILSALVMLAVTAGFILLVIPGIIVAIWLSFASYVFVIEGKKGIEALKASREHVRGYWWPVFGRFLALGLAMIVLSIGSGLVGMVLSFLYIPDVVAAAVVSFFISAIAMPIATAYNYLLYQDLRKIKETSSVVAETPAVNEAAV